MPTIKDVADAVGVSTATVSRVLANKPHVRSELRERVLAAATALNYRPSRVAQSLRTQQSSTIGLIVADIRNPYFTSVSRAVEDVAHTQKMAVFFCNSDEDPHKETLYFDLMLDENVAGIILAPTNRTDAPLARLVDPGLPLVLIDRHAPDLETDTVLIDNVESAEKLVSHLLDDGHRRIGAIFGMGSTTGRERRQGYVQALDRHGVEFLPDLASYVPAREEAGYRQALHLLSLPVPPDAIFASNGLLSAGAFRAIRERGLAIPDDVAFAAFDNTIWTSLVSPPVTVIDQPTYEIGRIAADLLFQRIQDPDRPVREVTLKGKLLVRGSCAHHP
jgi:LacI family transcriptional regulator, fructose operon transcriptional repressor